MSIFSTPWRDLRRVFDNRLGRRVAYGSALLLALTIYGDLPASESLRQPAEIATSSVEPEVSDDDWAKQMKGRLGPFSAETIRQSQLQAAATLLALQTQTADLPDGEIWRKTWLLNQLGEQLANPKPDVAAVRATAKSLTAAGPTALEPARRTLMYQLGAWAGMASATPDAMDRVKKNIAVLTRAAHRKTLALEARDEEAVRHAFRELASLRRFDDLLAEYRGSYSSFNYRTHLSDSYIEDQARRQFQIPVDLQTTAGGMRIHVRGTAVAEATVEVVPNPTQGELRVDVASVGRFALTGHKKKLTLSADSTQRLKSSQPIYLNPATVESPGPTVRDRSCTSLNWIQVCTRIPVVGRIVSRIARPIVECKLAEQDPVIARKVEEQVRERVSEEGFDIAYRINGRFGALGSEFFPSDGDKPRLTIRSASDGIVWSALYADGDSLGALSPPPEDTAAEFDVRHWAHESAVNNWGTRLNGKFLDEATFHSLLKEDFHFFSKDFEAFESLRSPAILLFAADEPLAVRFHDQAVELTLRLQGYALGREVNWKAPRVVKVRYRAVADAGGMRLVRDAEDFSKDAGWNKALLHFLPAVYEPLPRFQNSSFKTRLTLGMLRISEGWLTTGSRRVTETSVAPNLAQD
ncbi:MAG: hypothetical protein K8U03_10085 [Planctomycetia bacterium]|nr:hypothetical protein [Planctomycetia bacterium]